MVPPDRIRTIGDGRVSANGNYVLYWMTAFRRSRWNFSLQRAFELAHELAKPLLVFEPLRCDYRWASDRLHFFILHGMADNARRLSTKAATYYPYVETAPGEGKGLLAALAKKAAVVVGDDFPSFFLPRMVQAAGRQISVRFELVDSNGLLPMRAADKVFARAYDFRRFLQQELRPHLQDFPEPDPLYRRRLPHLDSLPKEVTSKWPAAKVKQLADSPENLADFPLDHDVRISPAGGGMKAAEAKLHHFIQNNLSRYAESRNQPGEEVTSGLSPYLHFGHISAHQVFHELMQREGWSIDKISSKATGSRDGWWGASEEAESFLDQLITWRELGYNMCALRDDHDQFDSLPDWARKTLDQHASDPREHVYSLEEFEAAATHNALWNAAQRQLLREGRIHNYMRMLWGKKILHWSASPHEALAIMIQLNNKYALDGRNPNSYSGIFWCLGRYDRAWGPERPIFGKVRYMSCDNAARKFDTAGYQDKYGDS